jgi:hypothetical protein
MSKIFGEAVQDPQSKKWGWSIVDEVTGPIGEPDYIFDTKDEAEAELVKALQGLGKLSKGA